jgi:predicted metal-dependent hydrolase
VVAPLRAPFHDVEAFLRDKQRWILAKLDHWSRAPRPRVLRIETGALLPLRGAEVALEVREAGRSSVRAEGGAIVVSAPGPRRAAQALVQWLKHEALDALTPRAGHYAAQLGFPPPRVGVTSARGQWGVCMEGGRIRLNWRLVHLREALADYVVAHEVAHLAEMNHSPRFWDLVARLYPAWREAREQLELAGASIPTILEA